LGRRCEKALETCFNFVPVLRTLAAFLAAAGLACAAAPASTPTPAIARGVAVAGMQLGGLSAEPARAKVEQAFARPLRVVYQGKRLRISPEQLGASSSVDGAVTAALAATPKSRIALPVRFSRSKIAALVKRFGHLYNRDPIDASVTGADADGPRFTQAKDGLAVSARTMRVALAQALQSGTRAPLALLTHPVAPHRTVAGFGPVIVVTRGQNTLRLFDGPRLVRTFRVATGQAVYPTPSGVWRIVTKQRDPWWYPPTYDDWAKGLKPVPPGPGNPLGTRWMGLNATGVGIHGTDAPASIGYSASHGCIRMQVPEAEWLFEHVDVGTPVVVL
jgi:lipoprotein-anchoring transpeptidase ErfK/SrfK